MRIPIKLELNDKSVSALDKNTHKSEKEKKVYMPFTPENI